MCISPGTIVGAIFNNCGATRDLGDEYKLSPLYDFVVLFASSRQVPVAWRHNKAEGMGVQWLILGLSAEFAGVFSAELLLSTVTAPHYLGSIGFIIFA